MQLEIDPRLPAEVLDVKLVIDVGDGRAGPGSYARIAARRPSAPTGTVPMDAIFTALDETDRERIAVGIEA